MDIELFPHICRVLHEFTIYMARSDYSKDSK